VAHGNSASELEHGLQSQVSDQGGYVMATMTGTAAACGNIKERFTPALETLEESVRQARRAVVQGRHAAEEFVTETTQQVKHHPIGAVAVAAGAGALAGCMLGFALGRWAEHKS
jgi:ElaB/YqjD/DUF883 family membrane-anchored ribosome-binding protein